MTHLEQGAIEATVRAMLNADPKSAELSPSEREAAVYALTGAAQVVVKRVQAVTRICKDAEDGMVSAQAVLEALNGGSVHA